jgi:hypothetical protein
VFDERLPAVDFDDLVWTEVVALKPSARVSATDVVATGECGSEDVGDSM